MNYNRNKRFGREHSGFFELEYPEICNHPSHNFPTHLYIPPGQGYTHVCPGCGYTITATNPLQRWVNTEIISWIGTNPVNVYFEK